MRCPLEPALGSTNRDQHENSQQMPHYVGCGRCCEEFGFLTAKLSNQQLSRIFRVSFVCDLWSV